MPVRFRLPGGQVPQQNVPDQHRHRPAPGPPDDADPGPDRGGQLARGDARRISRDAGLAHNEAIPALPLGAMCALIDYSVPADAVVVQEAIAGGTDVTADIFAEGGDVIGATYRERWKSTAGLSAEGIIAPVPEDVGQVVREVCRARQWDGLGNIQMMRRPEGGTVVYEINPRTAGSADLTRHAGFDFLGSVLRRVLGLNGDTTFAAEPVVPTVFRRDWSTEARCP